MSTLQRIRDTLAQALSPERLDVVDDSASHAGHVGAVPGKTTHVRVVVVAESFRGQSRIERHRYRHDGRDLRSSLWPVRSTPQVRAPMPD